MTHSPTPALKEVNKRIETLEARLSMESSLRMAYEALLTARVEDLAEHIKQLQRSA